jgi:hypothetical protein
MISPILFVAFEAHKDRPRSEVRLVHGTLWKSTDQRKQRDEMSERYLRPRICQHTDLHKPLRVEKGRSQCADHESDLSVR